MLKYLWQVYFEDGHHIKQPEDDRYSKHIEGADHNPSAFRDILDYEEISPVSVFGLVLNVERNNRMSFNVDLSTGEFMIDDVVIRLEEINNPLVDRKLIYYRTMEKDLLNGGIRCVAYNYGYEGKDDKGRVIKKVVTINE